MFKLSTNDIAVLDVTSRLVSAIVGVKKSQSVFGVKAIKEEAHSGYENGVWYDAEETAAAARKVLQEAMLDSSSRTKRLFIGVPAEFVANVTKEVSITLDRERRVVDADVDYLINKGNTFDAGKYSLINSSPVEFTIDTSSNGYLDVRGLTAGAVTGVISYALCERGFVDMFNEVASSLGFKEIKYVSSAWAEGISLFEKEERDLPYVLVDVGYISTSVLIGRGDGVLDLKSFSLGGGHVSADMCEALDVDFDLAEKARELVDLNLSYSDDAVLVADAENAIYGKEACEIVRAKLEELAEIILSIIEDSGVELPSYAPLYLTGEGIAAIRGAKKFLGEQLGRTVEIVTPKLPGFAKPSNASKVALLVVADTLSVSGFAAFIKKAFNGGKI